MGATMSDRFKIEGRFRRFAAAVTVLGTLTTSSGYVAAEDLPGKGVTVRPLYNGIAEELFEAYVVKLGLEDLGYTVNEFSQAQIPLAHLAVASGDGDYYTPHWYPLHIAFAEKAGGDAKAHRVGTLAKDSIQGYSIDKATADKYGIKTIDQLKDPKIAKLFDVDGDGKADLYGCDPGWGCERIIEHHLDAYGLRDAVTHKQGEYFALIADAIQRIQSGKPILYYGWTPTWINAILRRGQNVVWLSVPFTALPDEQAGANTTVPRIGNLGFPVNTHHVFANTAFLEKNPAANKWFELVQIPIQDIDDENLLVHEGEKSNDAILGHAAAWKKAHLDQWNDWIAQAKQAAK
ncbi:MAG: proline/glycine betaine ABC transporter substrate-binding protein ProX [Mesorhizobium sp.]|nr:MAG: proline/glycine betaine ABC transporter substrate-binding protein ProX [Mesorhizobium sp.]RWK58659.1 MAG: proline/glycine betaine ABC transporter substrate-binding protein ProX [Mesorhizobium sp.]RWM43125.1 MAG: proline/glycine betaine ABC transporter substrate-binding protein ProX [Mesorhizobium sp.]RWM45873.1 MAG: proline/glycine betaine ABC transporter substrate-binding protein ProX [Mesorhizobium sp.]RWM75084.1 MAG: proline/glycine betaine ABC transporter substrate-binding protein P